MPSFDEIIANIPPLPDGDLRLSNRKLFLDSGRTCVVVDDDPTGNQTVYDVPLLSDYSVENIQKEFKNKTPVFFILSNSRSKPAKKAVEMGIEIGKNIQKAAQATGRGFSVISRSDSTLRGHYPVEVDAISQGLGIKKAPVLIIPVMFEGGRQTIGDVHYLNDNGNLIPVGETPFAQDKSFGYQSSSLKDWVIEKTKGEVKAEQIQSISLETIRSGGSEAVHNQLIALNNDAVCIVNAAEYGDLDILCEALLKAEKAGYSFIYRTSSSFVPAYIGLPQKPLIDKTQLNLKEGNGGLIIVGSYVPKSTEQLHFLLENNPNIHPFEVEVSKIRAEYPAKDFIDHTSEKLDELIAKGETAVLYTSRALVSAGSAEENLRIGSMVTDTLIEIVRRLKTAPRFFIAKGGITSNDVAVKGLGMQRGVVRGQILPGVPLWELGIETKFPGVPYVVFPGNVGDAKAIDTVARKLG